MKRRKDRKREKKCKQGRERKKRNESGKGRRGGPSQLKFLATPLACIHHLRASNYRILALIVAFDSNVNIECMEL